jgi:hypothetical protein
MVPSKYKELANWCKYVPPPTSEMDRYVIFKCDEYSTFLCQYGGGPLRVGRHYGLAWDNIYTEHRNGFAYAWFSL